MNFIEWCEFYQGISLDDIMNNLSDGALKILEDKYKRYLDEQ